MLVIWQFGAFTFGGLGCKVGVLGFRVWAFTFGGSGLSATVGSCSFVKGLQGLLWPRNPDSRDQRQS